MLKEEVLALVSDKKAAAVQPFDEIAAAVSSIEITVTGDVADLQAKLDAANAQVADLTAKLAVSEASVAKDEGKIAQAESVLQS